ncbi:hypothetical protein AA0117_g12278 [Alternaria alternata]|uniref:Uncharacterized protein n=1 Tax=Alternaria alternata TaxID=5599 RepID=A0A4Q4MZS9_ALTAL|nr:hypothetical protein AA0117_g12278 [Alternaria alternata]
MAIAIEWHVLCDSFLSGALNLGAERQLCPNPSFRPACGSRVQGTPGPNTGWEYRDASEVIVPEPAESAALRPRDVVKRGELRQTEPPQVRETPFGPRMQTGLLGRKNRAAIAGDWPLRARARLSGNSSDRSVRNKLIGQGWHQRSHESLAPQQEVASAFDVLPTREDGL